MKVFFISADNDMEITKQIRYHFQNNGAACFEISEDLLPGQDKKVIQNYAMMGADYVVVILSKTFYATRGFHNYQVVRALEYADYSPSGERYILPVIIDYCQDKYRASNLSHLTPLDLTGIHTNYGNHILPILEQP